MTRRQRSKRRAQRWARTRWVRCPVRKQAERERQAEHRKMVEAVFAGLPRYDDVAEWAALRRRMAVTDPLASTDYRDCYVEFPAPSMDGAQITHLGFEEIPLDVPIPINPLPAEPIPVRADPQHEENQC